MQRSGSERYLLALTLAGTTLSQLPAPAVAAEAAASDSVEELVITGSRISRRDADAPSPIVTVTAAAIEKSGNINIEGAMNEMPQFTRDSSGGQGTGGRALLDLRGLGANRNLVLLDGRRLPISSSSGVVDTNLIPTGIIQNVEVITGGASAVYGSDAISGVVNFVTNRRFQGLRADLQYSNSEQGDYAGRSATAMMGGNFADGAGYAVVSLGYSKQDALWGKDRAEFFALGVPSSYIGQGTMVMGANQPSEAALSALFVTKYGTAGWPGSGNIGFNDDGTLFSQNGGARNYKGPIDLAYQIVGGGVRMPVLVQGTAKPSVERRNVFAKFDFKVSDSVTAYGQFLLTDHTANTNSGGTLTQFGANLTIPVTNPFIPADLATLLASRAAPTASFIYNGRYVMVPAKNWDENYVTQQYLGGLKGDLGAGDWTWDLYANYDNSRHNQQQNYAVFKSRVQTLFNAADGGNSICAGGFNPFGLANAMSMSTACQNYISGQTHSVESVIRENIELNVQGTVMQLPAGPMKASFTAGSRQDKYSFSPDKALAEQDVEAVIAAQASSGKQKVGEIAAEFAIPVLAKLDLGAAFRYSDYDLSGGTSTYKIDATWRPLDLLMVRGGYQRAIRAPNIGELYSAATGGQVSYSPLSPPQGGDPCDVRTNARLNDTGGKLRGLCIATGVPTALADSYTFPTTATASVTSGNLDLKPETASTYTFGAVFTPEIGGQSQLFLSVDYYKIDISNVISTVSGSLAINKCYNLDGSNSSYATDNVYCRILRRDSAGQLDLITLQPLNLGKLATSGFDIQANYKFDANFGRLSVDTAVNIVQDYKVLQLQGDPLREWSGTIGGTAPRPKLRTMTSFGWEKGDLSASLRWQHIDKMKSFSVVANPASTTPGASSYDKFDLVGNVKIRNKYKLRAGVLNLMDKGPLVVGGVAGNTDSELYDIVGRSYYLGLTAEL
jgi:outer membrane receptor protein involved in Fe transport